MELLLIILIVLVVLAFVAPLTGHALPGGNLVGLALLILLVFLLVYMFSGVAEL